MTTAINYKSTLPVSKAANFRGYSISGLHRRWQRETGGTYKYPTFYAVSSGRLRVPEIEEWLEKEGFGADLKEAQELFKASQEAANV